MRIKNWAKFQHFKDRRPPWIKLYRDILEDPDWHELDGDAAKVLVSLWLIASEDETQQGILPDIRRLAFRLRMSEEKLKHFVSMLSHWVEQDDIKVISTGYQVDAPETETETETETEKPPRERSSDQPQRPEDVSERVWADWFALRKQKKAVVTETVIQQAREQAALAGMDLQRFLEIWCLRGSQGLQASWLSADEKKVGRSAGSASTMFAGLI